MNNSPDMKLANTAIHWLNKDLFDVNIRLEGPEDPRLRNSSFGGHVTALTLQYLWPRPPGVWLGGPGCKPGYSGRS